MVNKLIEAYSRHDREDKQSDLDSYIRELIKSPQTVKESQMELIISLMNGSDNWEDFALKIGTPYKDGKGDFNDALRKAMDG